MDLQYQQSHNSNNNNNEPPTQNCHPQHPPTSIWLIHSHILTVACPQSLTLIELFKLHSSMEMIWATWTQKTSSSPPSSSSSLSPATCVDALPFKPYQPPQFSHSQFHCMRDYTRTHISMLNMKRVNCVIVQIQFRPTQHPQLLTSPK